MDQGVYPIQQQASPKKPEKLPTVMTKKEISRVLAAMSGTYQLTAKLLFG